MLVRRLMMRVKRLVSRPTRGVSVCFLGPDGSGKSTTIEEFSRLVGEELHWSVSAHYMGPWGHYHFPRFMRFASAQVPERWRDMSRARRQWRDRLGDRFSPSLPQSLRFEWRRRRRPLTPEEEEQRQFQRHTARAWIAFRFVRGHLRYWFFLGALSFELGWRYLKAWRAKRHGRVVVMDRYIYDFMSGAMHGIRSGYRSIRSLMCALYPRPDRTFLLHADPELIVARKQDLDLETMKEMQALYAAMGERWGMVRVSTEVPPDEVARGIIDREFDWFVKKRRV
jgi:thymidylate kinase